MQPVSLGVVFVPSLPPERLRAVAQAADSAGLDELWLWEDCFRESGFATAAAALAWSSRVRVCVGLVPAPLRNVALTAMETATLGRLFPGRFVLGVGHGVQDWMGQVGARVGSPLTLLREYVDALSALLAGRRLNSAGRYVQLRDVALDWPPHEAPAVYGGAVGVKTLALCAEVAQGTVLTGGTSPAQVRQACAVIDQRRRELGRTDPHQVVVYVMAATGPGAQERLAAETQRWDLPADTATLHGDAAAVAEGIARYVAAGATSVVLQPTQDEPDLEGLIAFAGQEVRPLL